MPRDQTTHSRMARRSQKNGGNAKFLKPNENEGTADKDFRDIAKAALRGKCVAMCVHVKKSEI